MIKIILISFLLCFSHFSYSADSMPQLPPMLPVPPAPAGFQTYGSGIPLSEFLKITLGEISHKSYIIAPDVSQTSLISADLSRSKLKDSLIVVQSILDSMNLKLKQVQDVYIIERKLESDSKSNISREMFIYKPKHRSVSSLSSYFSLFPDLTFTFSSGIAVRSPSASHSQLAGPGVAGAAQTMDSGATTFSAQDKDPTFLAVSGDSKILSKFEQFLSLVDVPIPEVLLKAYIFEVRDSKNKDSAIQLISSILSDKVSDKFSLSAGSDGLKLSFSNISIAVNALTGDSRVRLLSSPVLRAADGTTASASVGTDVPTLGSIVSQNGSTQQSVSYQSAGVLLTISPTILDDTIRLNISQEISSFVKTETGLSSTPTKLRRSFKSDVIVRSKEAILLGGLSEVQQTEANSTQFMFFSSDSKTSVTSQIVVLVEVERL